MTFTASVRVSERVMSPAQERIAAVGRAATSRGVVQLTVNRDEWAAGGHTAGLAADAAGAFHPVWIDNRTGVHQMWTARVGVAGTAIKNGDVALAELADVSSQVTLELTDAAYDRTRSEVTFEARLKNTSKDTVRGPFELRAITLMSYIGTAHATNADAGGSGDGAVWHFSAQVPGGLLSPASTSASRKLTFRIDGAPDAVLMTKLGGIIRVDATVLARRPASSNVAISGDPK
jgi:hypothetical protein